MQPVNIRDLEHSFMQVLASVPNNDEYIKDYVKTKTFRTLLEFLFVWVVLANFIVVFATQPFLYVKALCACMVVLYYRGKRSMIAQWLGLIAGSLYIGTPWLDGILYISLTVFVTPLCLTLLLPLIGRIQLGYALVVNKFIG